MTIAEAAAPALAAVVVSEVSHKVRKAETDGDPVRPLLYSDAIIDEICDALADGVPLRKWCNEDVAKRPAARTIRRWALERPEVNLRIKQARDWGSHAMADRAQERGTQEGLQKDDVPAARLAVETLLKLAAAHNPQTYGDRKLVQSSVDMNVRHDLGGLTREQRDVLLDLLENVMIDVTPQSLALPKPGVDD